MQLKFNSGQWSVVKINYYTLNKVFFFVNFVNLLVDLAVNLFKPSARIEIVLDLALDLKKMLKFAH